MEAKHRIFAADHLKQNIFTKFISSSVVTIFSRGIQLFLQVGSTMVLARLLTPEDFGLIAMVLVFIEFANKFKDLGLITPTVQQADINQKQISTLFWINAGAGVLIALLIVALSPLIAFFYEEPRLVGIMTLFAITIVLGAFKVQHVALARRQMRYKQLAFVEVISNVLRVCVAITLAWCWRETNKAYMALVWMHVSQAVFMLVGAWIILPWLPGLPSKGSGVRNMLKFGAHIIGFDMISYFSRNLDNILIGKFWGSAALGLYAKAYQIVYMPLIAIRDPIQSVAITTLSRLNQDMPKSKKYFGEIVFFMALLSMPLMAFCAIFPKELILLIFGEKWLGMTNIFRILSIAGFIQPVAGIKGSLLLSHGQSKVYFFLGVVNSLLLIAAYFIGVAWGPVGVATSYCITLYLIQYPNFYVISRFINFTFKDFIENCWYIGLISCSAVLMGRGVLSFLPVRGTNILVLGFAFALLFFSILFICIPKNIQRIKNSYRISRGNHDSSR